MATPLEACRDRLVSTVHRIVAESGNPSGSDSVTWADRWLAEPVPALGTTPRDSIHEGHDREVLVDLLLRMQSGAFS